MLLTLLLTLVPAAGADRPATAAEIAAGRKDFLFWAGGLARFSADWTFTTGKHRFSGSLARTTALARYRSKGMWPDLDEEFHWLDDGWQRLVFWHDKDRKRRLQLGVVPPMDFGTFNPFVPFGIEVGTEPALADLLQRSRSVQGTVEEGNVIRLMADDSGWLYGVRLDMVNRHRLLSVLRVDGRKPKLENLRRVDWTAHQTVGGFDVPVSARQWYENPGKVLKDFDGRYEFRNVTLSTDLNLAAAKRIREDPDVEVQDERKQTFRGANVTAAEAEAAAKRRADEVKAELERLRALPLPPPPARSEGWFTIRNLLLALGTGGLALAAYFRWRS